MIQEFATKYDESVRQLTEVANKLTASIEAGNKEKARAFLDDLLNARPKLDINITVPLSDNLQRKQENEFSVRVHVEDREAAGGVFIMKVRSCDTIFDLKKKFLLQYDLPIEVQRWIIGHKICEDKCSLRHCGVKGPGSTLYLYIVTAHSVGLTREAYEANKQAYAEGRFHVPMNPQLSTSSDGSFLASSFSAYTGKPVSPGVNSALLDSQFLLDNSNEGEKSSAFMASSWPNQNQHSNEEDLLGTFKPSNSASNLISASTSPMATIQSRDSGVDSGCSPENSGQHLSQALVSGSAASHTSPLSEEPVKPGWNCPSCTFRNLPTRPGCAMCSTSRPESYEIPPGYEMTTEEQLRMAVDEEMERKTREPGLLGLTYDQEQDAMLLSQEGIDLQQFQFQEVDEEGFQILPQSILQEQSFNNPPSNREFMIPQESTQMQGQPLPHGPIMADSNEVEDKSSGNSSKA